jgi:uncharacterized Fe-S radical SAM superfamily protein PflX
MLFERRVVGQGSYSVYYTGCRIRCVQDLLAKVYVIDQSHP